MLGSGRECVLLKYPRSGARGGHIHSYNGDIDTIEIMAPIFNTTYAQLDSDNTVVVYSSSADDVTQNVTVYGIDSTGKKASETIAVAGVAKIPGLITFSYIENIWMDVEVTTGRIDLAENNASTYTYIMEIERVRLNSGIAQHFNGECESYVTFFAGGLYEAGVDGMFELRWYPDDSSCRTSTGYEVLDRVFCSGESGHDNHPYPMPIGPLPKGGWLVVYAVGDSTLGWCTVQGFDIEEPI